MKTLWLLILFMLSVDSVAAATQLPFIQDDYGAALSQAKQRKVAIFVEVWAPW